jgi:hypothetical protein
LDISFRINTIDPQVARTRSELARFIKELSADPETKDKVPSPVLWYPE